MKVRIVGRWSSGSRLRHWRRRLLLRWLPTGASPALDCDEPRNAEEDDVRSDDDKESVCDGGDSQRIAEECENEGEGEVEGERK
ncbi:unnamed protein product [Soboliphyme baturini]|uniref:Uncharacterized protein n=1 Tax=Soboliphyme baturini TaxID=241478 RepID=A0A183ICK7_9BILA|nr:unnamed protein product [Soboliphyme baturini]